MKLNQIIAGAGIYLVTTFVSNAHTSYGGFARDFAPSQGTPISGFSATPYFKSITVASISTDSGWASGTEPQFGDAHHIRAFRFTLAEAGLATIRAEAVTSGFLPGFTLYTGLLNLTGGSPYDSAAATLVYLGDLGAPQPRDGALNTLGNVIMFNDAGNQSALNYFGNAADGTTGEFGMATGIEGDGIADGTVARTWWLGAGDYTIFVGGADVDGTGTATNYSVRTSLAVVPEPTSAMLIFLSGLGLVANRRR